MVINHLPNGVILQVGQEDGPPPQLVSVVGYGHPHLDISAMEI